MGKVGGKGGVVGLRYRGGGVAGEASELGCQIIVLFS